MTNIKALKLRCLSYSEVREKRKKKQKQKLNKTKYRNKTATTTNNKTSASRNFKSIVGIKIKAHSSRLWIIITLTRQSKRSSNSHSKSTRQMVAKTTPVGRQAQGASTVEEVTNHLPIHKHSEDKIGELLLKSTNYFFKSFLRVPFP